jgi:branched-chain amino acid transport system permease protein
VLAGALVGLVFGLPSLRLRGLYLAVSTLALHFIVVYLGGEYESARGLSSGITVDPPVLAGVSLTSPVAWYAVLASIALAAVVWSVNLVRGRIGRGWRALHGREAVAEALGIDVPRAKLAAFVISSAMAALAGSLFAYWRGFVSIEAFSMFLTIQYVAMLIVGGMGSIAGAVLGAVFVVLFPYAIEAAMNGAGLAGRLANSVYAVNQAAFGVVMMLFLLFEPEGLIGIWRRARNWLVLWPFKQRPLPPS